MELPKARTHQGIFTSEIRHNFEFVIDNLIVSVKVVEIEGSESKKEVICLIAT